MFKHDREIHIFYFSRQAQFLTILIDDRKMSIHKREIPVYCFIPWLNREFPSFYPCFVHSLGLLVLKHPCWANLKFLSLNRYKTPCSWVYELFISPRTNSSSSSSLAFIKTASTTSPRCTTSIHASSPLLSPTKGTEEDAYHSQPHSPLAGWLFINGTWVEVHTERKYEEVNKRRDGTWWHHWGRRGKGAEWNQKTGNINTKIYILLLLLLNSLLRSLVKASSYHVKHRRPAVQNIKNRNEMGGSTRRTRITSCIANFRKQFPHKCGPRKEE